MSNFAGGSAVAMARQIAEGSVPVTESGLRRLSGAELDDFSLAIEELQREIRRPPTRGDDADAVRERNLRIERLNTCRMMLRTYSRHRRS